jgi:hypothetical protein
MRLGRGHIGFAVAALVSAATAASASAHPPAPVTVGGRPITGTVHRWLHQAKAPLVHGRVQLVFRACPRHAWLAACVFSNRPRRIYIRRGLVDQRRILYHELGHVFDFKVLNRRERRRFKRVMHLRRRGWYGGGGRAAEWFADGYSLCALGHRLDAATPYGYQPARRQHRAVCRLISRAAKPRGAPAKPPRNPPPVVEPPAPPPPPADPAPPPESCGLFGQVFGCPQTGISSTNSG